MEKIYFFIGTKAQAIKCISLINFLSCKPNLSVVIVNSGQHTKITESIFKNLNSKVNYVNLFSNKQNISKYLTGIIWTLKFIFKNIIFKTLGNKESKKNKSICIVHGDTVSTLLGLLWAKRNHCKVLHLESGLTSKSILNPFPEEAIRKITARFSDILVCFDADAFNRLKNKYKNKYVLKVSENTIIETLGNLESEKVKKRDLIIATLHRTENILSKKRLINFIKLLEKLSYKFEVRWYLHEPTLNSLKKYKLKISKNINTFNLLEHEEFINLLKQSKLVITDGGSIQEECFYLGLTTIIWRNATERPYALNNNMFISNFDVAKSHDFVLDNVNKQFKFKFTGELPSAEIYKYLKDKNFILND